MDKYRKVKVERPQVKEVGQVAEGAAIPETQGMVWVAAGGKIRSYLTVCTELLGGDPGKAEGITVVGLGEAINKTVTVVECVKRLVPGLHQITQISTVSITEEWEPTQKGLEKILTSKITSCIKIFLTTNPAASHPSHSCYQGPLPSQTESPEALIDAVVEDAEKVRKPYKLSSRQNKKKASHGEQAGKGRNKEKSAAGAPAATGSAEEATATKKNSHKVSSRRRKAQKAADAKNSAEANGGEAPPAQPSSTVNDEK
ncbi:Ribonuclease P protein subunit p25-like protein [Porphyridium purpureum]|uniref:Ribonuclease P protein subunit p25-like protein n=1 Tax=Porphyridium purpureum TaxID=35688 RepID=A0A5J4ZA97_PORPP|nr:Ribonuclease P protein subunit p25-like protein [Porphyridium purpureum]|eukprot:POR1084..scf295_1